MNKFISKIEHNNINAAKNQNIPGFASSTGPFSVPSLKYRQ